MLFDYLMTHRCIDVLAAKDFHPEKLAEYINKFQPQQPVTVASLHKHPWFLHALSVAQAEYARVPRRAKLRHKHQRIVQNLMALLNYTKAKVNPVPQAPFKFSFWQHCLAFIYWCLWPNNAPTAEPDQQLASDTLKGVIESYLDQELQLPLANQPKSGLLKLRTHAEPSMQVSHYLQADATYQHQYLCRLLPSQRAQFQDALRAALLQDFKQTLAVLDGVSSRDSVEKSIQQSIVWRHALSPRVLEPAIFADLQPAAKAETLLQRMQQKLLFVAAVSPMLPKHLQWLNPFAKLQLALEAWLTQARLQAASLQTEAAFTKWYQACLNQELKFMVQALQPIARLDKTIKWLDWISGGRLVSPELKRLGTLVLSQYVPPRLLGQGTAKRANPDKTVAIESEDLLVRYAQHFEAATKRIKPAVQPAASAAQANKMAAIRWQLAQPAEQKDAVARSTEYRLDLAAHNQAQVAQEQAALQQARQQQQRMADSALRQTNQRQAEQQRAAMATRQAMNDKTTKLPCHVGTLIKFVDRILAKQEWPEAKRVRMCKTLFSLHNEIYRAYPDCVMTLSEAAFAQMLAHPDAWVRSTVSFWYTRPERLEDLQYDIRRLREGIASNWHGEDWVEQKWGGGRQFDLESLPAGFYLQDDKGGVDVCFSPELIKVQQAHKNSSHAPLRPQDAPALDTFGRVLNENKLTQEERGWLDRFVGNAFDSHYKAQLSKLLKHVFSLRHKGKISIVTERDLVAKFADIFSKRFNVLTRENSRFVAKLALDYGTSAAIKQLDELMAWLQNPDTEALAEYIFFSSGERLSDDLQAIQHFHKVIAHEHKLSVKALFDYNAKCRKRATYNDENMNPYLYLRRFITILDAFHDAPAEARELQYKQLFKGNHIPSEGIEALQCGYGFVSLEMELGWLDELYRFMAPEQYERMVQQHRGAHPNWKQNFNELNKHIKRRFHHIAKPKVFHFAKAKLEQALHTISTHMATYQIHKTLNGVLNNFVFDKFGSEQQTKHLMPLMRKARTVSSLSEKKQLLAAVEAGVGRLVDRGRDVYRDFIPGNKLIAQTEACLLMRALFYHYVSRYVPASHAKAMLARFEVAFKKFAGHIVDRHGYKGALIKKEFFQLDEQYWGSSFLEDMVGVQAALDANERQIQQFLPTFAKFVAEAKQHATREIPDEIYVGLQNHSGLVAKQAAKAVEKSYASKHQQQFFGKLNLKLAVRKKLEAMFAYLNAHCVKQNGALSLQQLQAKVKAASATPAGTHAALSKAERVKLDLLGALIEMHYKLTNRGGKPGQWMRLEQVTAVLLSQFCPEYQKSIFEIHTAEGKTLIIRIIALLRALQGDKVVVITHNKDLAKDNCLGATPLSYLNEVSVGAVTAPQQAESNEDICYVEASAFVMSKLLRQYHQGAERKPAADKPPYLICDEYDFLVEKSARQREILSEGNGEQRLAANVTAGLAQLYRFFAAATVDKSVAALKLFCSKAGEAKSTGLAWPQMQALLQQLAAQGKPLRYWQHAYRAISALRRDVHYVVEPGDKSAEAYVKLVNVRTNGEVNKPHTMLPKGQQQLLCAAILHNAIAESHHIPPPRPLAADLRARLIVPSFSETIAEGDIGSCLREAKYCIGLSGTAGDARKREVLSKVTGINTYIDMPHAKKPVDKTQFSHWPKRPVAGAKAAKTPPIETYSRCLAFKDADISLTAEGQEQKIIAALRNLSQQQRRTYKDGAERIPPTLIFCETIAECEALARKIQAALPELGADDLQILDGTASEDDALRPTTKDVLRRSKLGVLTLSTAAGGRGTDFDNVECVIYTKPSTRDARIQALHRGGRKTRAICKQMYKAEDLDLAAFDAWTGRTAKAKSLGDSAYNPVGDYETRLQALDLDRLDNRLPQDQVMQSLQAHFFAKRDPKLRAAQNACWKQFLAESKQVKSDKAKRPAAVAAALAPMWAQAFKAHQGSAVAQPPVLAQSLAAPGA